MLGAQRAIDRSRLALLVCAVNHRLRRLQGRLCGLCALSCRVTLPLCLNPQLALGCAATAIMPRAVLQQIGLAAPNPLRWNHSLSTPFSDLSLKLVELGSHPLALTICQALLAFGQIDSLLHEHVLNTHAALHLSRSLCRHAVAMRSVTLGGASCALSAAPSAHIHALHPLQLPK